MSRFIPELMTLSAAEKLAERIRDYWAARGKYPKVWVADQKSAKENGPLYVVRSDMVNGLPQKAAEKVEA